MQNIENGHNCKRGSDISSKKCYSVLHMGNDGEMFLKKLYEKGKEDWE